MNSETAYGGNMLMKLSGICDCNWVLVVGGTGCFAMLERFTTPPEAIATASSNPGAGTARGYWK